MRWKLVADTLFSQPVSQETKAPTMVDVMVSTPSMERYADEVETLNLSDIYHEQFWLAMYHRNMSTFLAISREGQPWDSKMLGKCVIIIIHVQNYLPLCQT